MPEPALCGRPATWTTPARWHRLAPDPEGSAAQKHGIWLLQPLARRRAVRPDQPPSGRKRCLGDTFLRGLVAIFGAVMARWHGVAYVYAPLSTARPSAPIAHLASGSVPQSLPLGLTHFDLSCNQGRSLCSRRVHSPRFRGDERSSRPESASLLPPASGDQRAPNTARGARHID